MRTVPRLVGNRVCNTLTCHFDFRLVESHLGAIQNMPLVATSSGGIHDERAATVADLVAKPLLPKDLASDDVLQACPALEPFVSGGLPGAQDMVATLAQRSDASIHGDSSSEQSPGDGSDGGSDNGSGSGGDTSDGGDDSDGSDVGSRTSRSRRSARKTSARTPSTGKRGARRSSRAAAGAKSSGAPKTTRLGARSRPQHQLITLWKSIHSNKYAPPFRKPVWLTVVLLPTRINSIWVWRAMAPAAPPLRLQAATSQIRPTELSSAPSPSAAAS